MNFSERLKELREDKKISMLQLAKCIGVSDAAICKWENAQTEPKASNLLSLAEFFEVSSDFLLGLENEFGNKKYGEPQLTNEKKPALTKDEQKLLDTYRALNDKNRMRVSAYVSIRLEEQEEQKSIKS